MKKLLFLLPVALLIACDKTDYYEVVKTELTSASPQIISSGTMGDFLVKVPETPALKKVASKSKNSKFLSINNPNSFAEKGYCLINIIPLLAWQKVGTPDNTCNYRIYCGAPESMNYDKYYSVEICDNK